MGSIRCVVCGRFIGWTEIEKKEASLEFTSDNAFSPEISEWTCGRCRISLDCARWGLNELNGGVE